MQRDVQDRPDHDMHMKLRYYELLCLRAMMSLKGPIAIYVRGELAKIGNRH